KAASPEEQYRYLYALADFEEPALIDRALALSTTPQIRSQDAAIYLGRFLENPAARDRAWTFVTAHWTELASKVTVSGGDTRIVSATGAFCDATHRDAVTAFFAAHPLPGVSRTLDQAVERINNCIALRESQSAVLGRWLEQLPTR
ncbi:MAG TPA: ERAP1-like C-terminal domain-containing protein, partial [Vicinamibacterales bacterium]|nr:ERAP1-like C-terminal domain-containing protein [Vicinamibacterales bacterium]